MAETQPSSHEIEQHKLKELADTIDTLLPEYPQKYVPSTEPGDGLYWSCYEEDGSKLFVYKKSHTYKNEHFVEKGLVRNNGKGINYEYRVVTSPVLGNQFASTYDETKVPMFIAARSANTNSLDAYHQLAEFLIQAQKEEKDDTWMNPRGQEAVAQSIVARRVALERQRDAHVFTKNLHLDNTPQNPTIGEAAYYLQGVDIARDSYMLPPGVVEPTDTEIRELGKRARDIARDHAHMPLVPGRPISFTMEEPQDQTKLKIEIIPDEESFMTLKLDLIEPGKPGKSVTINSIGRGFRTGFDSNVDAINESEFTKEDLWFAGQVFSFTNIDPNDAFVQTQFDDLFAIITRPSLRSAIQS